MNRLTKAIAVARRRALIVLIGAFLGALGASTVAGAQSTSYSATATLGVPLFTAGAGDGDDAPLFVPLEANRLAASYASVIRVDPSILEFVAEETGRSAVTLEDRIGVAHVIDSALIEIKVTAGNPDAVSEILAAVNDAVTGSSPVSRSIAPDSLETIGITQPKASTGVGSAFALGAGLFVGGTIGVVISIFWERSYPRVDTAPEIYDLLGIPARGGRQLLDGHAAWTLQQWYDQTGPDAAVLVVACGRVELSWIAGWASDLAGSAGLLVTDTSADADPLADVAAHGPDGVPDVAITVGSGASSEDPHLIIRASYPPGHVNGMHPASERPGLVMLAVAPSTRATEVAATVGELVEIGLPPRSAVLLG